MRHWLCVMHEDTSQLVEVARAAEEVGYHGIAVADHVAVPHDHASAHPGGESTFTTTTPFPDPFTSIAAMAVATTRLRFLPYVLVLPMRDPFTVAKQAATVSILSGNRFALGVGAGWLREEIALLGHDPRTRGSRLDEMLAVMRAFWDDGVVEWHGRHFDFGPTSMYPRPEAHIPVWVGGRSDVALRRAARHDGWLGMNYAVEEIPGLLARLQEQRRQVLDERGGDAGPVSFETLVIPQAPPSRALYEDLEAWGVTSTVVVAWPPGDPAFASLASKRAAMEACADACF